jgi:hypothetical protein
MNRLPTPLEAAQLLRLRALRVTRAQERCTAAGREVSDAQGAVHQRQQLIDASRSAIGSLAQAVVTSLAVHLPRWNGWVDAHRAGLAERLERDEDAMIDDARRLADARAAQVAAQVELARSRARQDVVRGLEEQARRGHLLAVEQRSELEVEDQGRAAATCQGLLR